MQEKWQNLIITYRTDFTKKKIEVEEIKQTAKEVWCKTKWNTTPPPKKKTPNRWGWEEEKKFSVN